MSLLDEVVEYWNEQYVLHRQQHEIDKYDPIKWTGHTFQLIEGRMQLPKTGTTYSAFCAGVASEKKNKSIFYRDLFNGFRKEGIKEEIVLDAEEFFLDSVFAGGWNKSENYWNIHSYNHEIVFNLMYTKGVGYTLFIKGNKKCGISYNESYSPTKEWFIYTPPNKTYHLNLAKHLVRRMVQYQSMSSYFAIEDGKWNEWDKKYRRSFKNYYSAQRWRAKETGQKYKPWGI